MKHISPSCVCLALLLGCGCEHNVYEVTLRPTTDGVERELACWREEPSGENKGLRTFPEEELERIAMTYKAPVPEAEAKVFTFVANFGDRMPQDIGGSGRFRECRTALGSLFVYAERFRGEDDLAARLTDKLAAVDEFAALVDGWLAAEIGKTDGWASLHGLLSGDLRADMKNLIVTFWARGLEGDGDDAMEEASARALLTFCERGYFAAPELPLVLQGLSSLGDSPEGGVRVLRHAVATKLELGPDAPILDALTDRLAAADVEESLSAHIAATDRWRAQVAELRKASDDEGGDESSAKLLTEHLAERMFPFELGGGPNDKLLVELHCSGAPLTTNGEWHRGTKSVRWETVIRGQNRLPTFVHASWVRVDKAGQKSRFGRVLLEGEQLAEYAMWRHALPEMLGKQWDAFEGGLADMEDVAAAVEAFRFASPEGAPVAGDLAKDARALIVGKLRGE